MQKPLRIAIIGAGTAGLAAANLLAKQSHHITIFEKVEELAPVGAGLLLQPSGLRVLDKMGVLEHACELGAPVSGLVGKLPSGKKIVNSFYTEAHPDYFGLGIHRASLCHVLKSSLNDLPVTWHMGCSVTQVIQQDKNHSNTEALVTFTQANDEQPQQGKFDLVLICNGAKSHLRPKAWTLLDKPYPWGAVWSIVPECEILDAEILHQFYDNTNIMLGVLPTGSLPATEAKAVKAKSQKLSSVFWSLPMSQLTPDITTEEKTELIITETQKRWSNVASWLKALPSNTNWLHANYRDVVMNKYGEMSIGVLGDAAHAMSPQLGQGANMALLDAWAISEAINNSKSLDDVWQHYHHCRMPSIQFYQRMSRLLTPFYQSNSKGLGKLRDLSFSWMYHIPWLRKQMALTISGVKTGYLSKLDLGAIHTRD